MTKESMVRAHRIYNILLSIVIVIAGICLIAGCLSIYLSGDKPFSRESVAATFSGIAFPVYLCLAMIILSFVLELISSSGKEKNPSQKPYAFMLSRLHSQKDLSQCDESSKAQILALQKNRKLHIIIRTIVLGVSSVIFLVYALNGDNFHQSEINSSMIKAMYVLIPCLLVSFGYALFVSIHNEKSIQKEIELMKQFPASRDSEETIDSSEKNVNLVRSVVLVVAVIFAVYGFITGGTIDVLAKAINICTECIGLG